ncbi:MAG: transcription termination/antitermination protein NusA [Candidatus Pacebacteria bacterium]|nr:transcription termination/antitermination protein NusA [Candidatus Paceibacterota bacterium]
MFDIKNFMSAIAQIAEEKSISPEKVLETIEVAIAAAYKKDYGKKGQIIKAKLDPESGDVQFKQVKIVVDKKMIYSEEELEKMSASSADAPTRRKEEGLISEAEDKKIRFNLEKHIMFEEAKKINSKIKVGEELETDLEEKKDYGRIAAQTAKQVILQKIREAEKESIFTEYKSKEGEIVSGIVQRIEGRNVFMDIGKTLGILPREEQVPGEFYRPGQRLKVFLLKVEETPRGPVILLSRAYPKLISKLFELEAPEVSSGQVQIKSIAREAGFRSKIAVSSETEGIDPIGSMVGQKGTRVMAVINELGGEKIDIIEYSPDSEKYIANSLSPAKVLEVKIMPKSKAIVIVPEDQLSLAIGKDGQNVRLAAKLTGWKIDVKAEGYAGEEKKEEKKEEEPKEKKETKKPKKKETKKVKK